MSLSAGNANCPTGGSSFTVGGTTTYACNGATGATGATGAQGPTGPAGGATHVKDANNNDLGILMSLNTGNFQVLTSTGHTILINHDGTFPISQIRWSGAGCTGTPYFNSNGQRYGKYAAYSGVGGLLVPADVGANGVSLSATVTVAAIENPACGSGTSTGSYFKMVATTQTGIGLPATITAPFTFQ
jgi:hypothetical protein